MAFDVEKMEMLRSSTIAEEGLWEMDECFEVTTWVVDFAERDLKWTKWMKESLCQNLEVLSLLFS